MEINNDGSFSFPRKEEYISPLGTKIRNILSIVDQKRWDSISKLPSSPKRLLEIMQYPLTPSECYQEILKGRTPKLKL